MAEEVRDGLKYTESHEWIKITDSTAIIGITDHAQTELTDIVYVELCVVESVKSVSEIYAPISGKIIKINQKLEDAPETINASPYDEGWLVEIEITNKDELKALINADAYKKI